VVWLTEAERELGTRLWGPLPGTVAAMPVCTRRHEPAREKRPYLLYCGRIDTGKDCHKLIGAFLAFKEKHDTRHRLILTGEDHLGVPRKHKELEYRGFVPPQKKYGLMAGASLFVMPSPRESFSLATLEAMAQGAPVLVNGKCEVLAEHVRRSGGGATYGSAGEFVERLEELLGDPARLKELGERGRQYVLAHYDADEVRERLVRAIEGAAAAA
jgi:glycosyltransferase involved in cell wall biosynthesis